MNSHSIHLHPIPFENIRKGAKAIESRLNDEKRRRFKVGDRLTFISRTDETKIESTIIALHHFPTFRELFAALPNDRFGGASVEELLLEIEQFYTQEDQATWGVVGIEFKTTPEHIEL